MVRKLTRRNFLSYAAFAAASPIFEIKPLRGIDFILQNSPTPQKYLIETMPGGAALFDYNNDGLLDIFLVKRRQDANSLHVPENFERAILAIGIVSTARIAMAASRMSRQAAKLSHAGNANYGMGVAVGDYDNGRISRSLT